MITTDMDLKRAARSGSSLVCPSPFSVMPPPPCIGLLCAPGERTYEDTHDSFTYNSPVDGRHSQEETDLLTGA